MDSKKYDFLIVGAGPFGSVCARELTDAGYAVCVIDKRDHIGGNCFTKEVSGVHVHTYGAHIFHTNDKKIWDWVNRYAEFNSYRHKVIGNYKGEIYSLPFSMYTFSALWGVTAPDQAKAVIEKQSSGIKAAQNLEEFAIGSVGTDVYDKLIRGYTKKQWGRDPKALPQSIIKRLPVRYTYNNDYFDDTYQGIPIGGYTRMFEKILQGIEVHLSEDFFEDRDRYESESSFIIYSGPIDRLFDYSEGALEYRTVRFEHTEFSDLDYQGCSVVNYTDEEVPFTRIIEHKHFDHRGQKNTVVTHEYPAEWCVGSEPYYPINDEKNNYTYTKYKKKASELRNYYFGGRLGSYRYYDMHQVIAEALKLSKHLIETT